MYKHSKCNCVQKIETLQLCVKKLHSRLQALQVQLSALKLSQKSFFNQISYDETFLLEKSIQKNLFQMMPIKQQMHRVNQTVLQLTQKCQMIPILKNNISMQTKIIEHLSNSINITLRNEEHLRILKDRQTGKSNSKNSQGSKNQCRTNQRLLKNKLLSQKRKCACEIKTDITINDGTSINLFQLTPSESNYD